MTAPDTGILTRQRCTTIDTPDTPDSFLDRLHTVADQAQDLLVVYYAGHGILHETKDDVLYLTVVLLALSLLFVIAIPNGGVVPEQGSALAIDVGGIIVCGTAALACAIALLRRITR